MGQIFKVLSKQGDHNLAKTWLGDFWGDFSLSLGDFLTETSGHPVSKVPI
jgi:hypothetical protein